MTVLIAKVISRMSTPFYGVNAVPLPRPLFSRIFVPFSVKREFLAAAFLLFTALAAMAYIIEMNVIIFEGKRLAELDVVAKTLEHEQKLKYSLLASIRSPLAIKKEAVDGIKMVEVKDVQYLDNTESVAANTLRMP